MTPAEAAVAREIVRIARDELRLDGDPPAPDEPLAERLDSLALLGLVVAVEDHFLVKLTDDDAAEARTLADLARIVATRAPAGRLPGAAAPGDEPPPQPRSAGRRKSGDEPPPQPRFAGRRKSGDEPPPQPRSAGRRKSGDEP